MFCSNKSDFSLNHRLNLLNTNILSRKYISWVDPISFWQLINGIFYLKSLEQNEPEEKSRTLLRHNLGGASFPCFRTIWHVALIWELLSPTKSFLFHKVVSFEMEYILCFIPIKVLISKREISIADSIKFITFNIKYSDKLNCEK